MTEDEAVALMVDGGFQEEAEARAKYNRARLSSTQLSTYFAGSMEMWDIELEARRRAAAAAGQDPDAIRAARPARRVRRDAGFVYRQHLEAVIGHGSPPTWLLRRILFDWPSRRRRTALAPRLRGGAVAAVGAGSLSSFAKSIDPVAGASAATESRSASAVSGGAPVSIASRRTAQASTRPSGRGPATPRRPRC